MLMISLNQIYGHNPCASGWRKLLKSKGKTKADNELFPLTDLLVSNGINDAVWCLRVYTYWDSCLFLADIAKLLSHIPNAAALTTKLTRNIRDYHDGLISLERLAICASDASDAADAANKPVSNKDIDSACMPVILATNKSVSSKDIDSACMPVILAATATAKAVTVILIARIVNAGDNECFNNKLENLFIEHFGA